MRLVEVGHSHRGLASQTNRRGHDDVAYNLRVQYELHHSEVDRCPFLQVSMLSLARHYVLLERLISETFKHDDVMSGISIYLEASVVVRSGLKLRARYGHGRPHYGFFCLGVHHSACDRLRFHHPHSHHEESCHCYYMLLISCHYFIVLL